MTANGGELTALIPGLAGPHDPGTGDPAEAVRVLLADRALPALSRLLSRAAARGSPLDGTSPDALLFQIFGHARPEGGDWPAGAVSRQGVRGDAHTGVWLRADPVHLRADMGRLILFSPAALNLAPDESSAIAEWLNAHEHYPGPELEPASPGCWHARLEAVPDMSTRSAHEAHGLDADSCLPRGPDAAAWHGRMNEIQMLLHRCPVNEARAQRRQPQVNSLWFWGAGALPGRTAPPCERAWGDHDVLAGLAACAQCDAAPRPADPRRWLAQPLCRRNLVLIEDLAIAARDADLAVWGAGLEALDRDWFQPVADALAHGRIHTLHVHAGGGCGFSVSARALRRWWRRVRPPAALFAELRAAPGA